MLEINTAVCAPGLGVKDKVVESQSRPSPYLVHRKATLDELQYKCDDKCPHYTCSHTIATTETYKIFEMALLSWKTNAKI